MYKVGDRVQVTAWDGDLEHTMVVLGTIEKLGDNNDVVVRMDDGNERQLHLNEIEKLA